MFFVHSFIPPCRTEKSNLHCVQWAMNSHCFEIMIVGCVSVNVGRNFCLCTFHSYHHIFAFSSEDYPAYPLSERTQVNTTSTLNRQATNRAIVSGNTDNLDWNLDLFFVLFFSIISIIILFKSILRSKQIKNYLYEFSWKTSMSFLNNLYLRPKILLLKYPSLKANPGFRTML